jgi:hypothetical protein
MNFISKGVCQLCGCREISVKVGIDKVNLKVPQEWYEERCAVCGSLRYGYCRPANFDAVKEFMKLIRGE